jgi:hypothetical protein
VHNHWKAKGIYSLLSVALATLVVAACGGGSGGGGGGSPTPVPTVPLSSPTPNPGPTPSPTPIGRVQTLLRDGDQVADGVVVANIEDGAISNDGRVAVIISISGANGGRAVYLRSPSGSFTPVFDSSNAPPEVDLRTLATIRMSGTGEVIFQSGEGLDSDRLYLAANGTVQTIAGAPPGITAPTFRILGEVRISDGGLVGFAGGGDPCTISTVGGQTRIRCTLHLFVATPDGVKEAIVSGVDLSDQTATQPRVAIGGTPEMVYFSIPSDNTQPGVVRVNDGRVETVLAQTADVGIGTIERPQVIGVNASGDVLLTPRLQATGTNPTVVGVLRGRSFGEIAREGDRVGQDVITSLRGIGIDTSGQALYQATIGSTSGTATTVQSLRLGDTRSSTELVREGQPIASGDLTVITLDESRINRAGDVAYTVELGTIDGGTVRIEEIRVVVRHPDGSLVTVASTRDSNQVGSLSSLKIVALDENGGVLIIATGARSSDRLLLLADSN